MRAAAYSLLLAFAAVFASPPAEAHGRSRVSIGVGFGYWGPFWGPPWWYYPGPYYSPYYYPPPVVIQRGPVTYIEQGSSDAPAAGSSGWWYYCDASKAYYPYVKECPSGWQRVAPAPANK
jgi:hypothetical protein